MTDSALYDWSRLLAAVPGSRLALKGPQLRGAGTGGRGPGAATTSHGIAGDRVELLERTETLEAHLAAYGGIDLALDTFPSTARPRPAKPFGWASRSSRSRGTGTPAGWARACSPPSAIRNGSLPDAADYVHIAAEVAAGGERRTRAAREELRAAVRRSALCDHPAQARRFGSALRAMWRTWCAQTQAGT